MPSPLHASQRPPLTLNENRPGLVPARLRFRHRREELADRREEPGVGRRVRARRAADRALVDLDHLVEVLDAVERFVRAGLLPRPLQIHRQPLVERVGDERALARSRNTGDADEGAERERDRDVAQVVLARAAQHQRTCRCPGRRCAGIRSPRRPLRILAGDRSVCPGNRRHVAFGDDVATVLAGAGPDIDDPVGRAHHVFVVLDDDQRIADVAQALQRLDQSRIVALMQTDARLVEDVEHTHQARADLGREPDALGFAAGKGVGRSFQRQVVESDIDQEAEPLADFLQDLPRDQ